MASIPMVLQQIRRARRKREREEKASSSHPGAAVSRFEEYRPAYEQTLSEAAELAGDDALDDVADWAVAWTKTERELPGPNTFRTHTRRILEERGVEIPPGSMLHS